MHDSRCVMHDARCTMHDAHTQARKSLRITDEQLMRCYEMLQLRKVLRSPVVLSVILGIGTKAVLAFGGGDLPGVVSSLLGSLKAAFDSTALVTLGGMGRALSTRADGATSRSAG